MLSTSALVFMNIWLFAPTIRHYHLILKKMRKNMYNVTKYLDFYSRYIFIPHLSELLRELAQDGLLVEELALVAVLKILGDLLAHVARQLAVRHVLLHLLQLNKSTF